jgi:predicted nucleic acid-binding protein
LASVIVLDASVLVAYLDGRDKHHEQAEALLVTATHDDLGVNPLTLAEALVAPVHTGQLETVLSVLRDLEVETLPFPANTSVRLAQLRARTSLRMPDCCVLLAAEDTEAAVATFDTELALAAETLCLAVLQS